MALGDGNYSNNNKDNNKQQYYPTVYSDYKFKNEKSIDPSELAFAHWRGLLKITISPKAEKQGSTEYTTYDHENNASIHLSAMKARILHNEILALLKDPAAVNSVGVASGASGLITFSNGKELGISDYALIIRKMDESGNIQSSYAYVFNGAKFHQSIRNFDDKSLSYDSFDYALIEIEAFLDQLKEFYLSATYSTAYTVVESMKYDMSRISTKQELMMDKLGIPKYNGKGGNSSQGSGRSFFQRANEQEPASTPARSQTSLDDLENELG